jgi:hypothetical protein
MLCSLCSILLVGRLLYLFSAWCRFPLKVEGTVDGIDELEVKIANEIIIVVEMWDTTEYVGQDEDAVVGAVVIADTIMIEGTILDEIVIADTIKIESVDRDKVAGAGAGEGADAVARLVEAAGGGAVEGVGDGPGALIGAV